MTDAARTRIRLDGACAQLGHGIVDRGVTQGALNSDGLERSGRIEEAGNADDGV